MVAGSKKNYFRYTFAIAKRDFLKKEKVKNASYHS